MLGSPGCTPDEATPFVSCSGGERRERRDGPPLPGVGEEVSGKVSRIVGYGVFIDLDGNKVRMISIAASPYAASTACGH